MQQASAPRRVLFGARPDGAPGIQDAIDAGAYAATFASLDTADIAGFDCVVPMDMADYATLSAHPDCAAASVLMPDPDLVALCDDKAAFNAFLAEAGFGALLPRVYAPGEAASYPIVVKPRRGAWGEGVRILQDAAAEAAAPTDAGWVRQAYVPGRAPSRRWCGGSAIPGPPASTTNGPTTGR